MKNEYCSMKKRLLAIVMTLMMIFQMMPAGAFADGEGRIVSDTWSAKGDDNTYHIVFKNTAGEEVGWNYVPINDPPNPINNPAPGSEKAGRAPKDGQTFINWYCGDIEFSTSYIPSDDMVFTPRFGWEVRFRNRDGDILETRIVEDGEAIGALPTVPAREDYIGRWTKGTQSSGSQGGWDPGTDIGADTIVNSSLDIVPDYDKITYTITFYKTAEKTEALTTKTVDVDTSYCLNDMPDVPTQQGSLGRWVYSGGDFTNQVAVSGDTDVWPAYEQNVFTVTFVVESEEYESDTYFDGDTLTLPTDPVVEGKQFEGWFSGETEYTGGETVTEDLTLTAQFEEEYFVNFVVLAEDSGAGEDEVLSQYFRTSGEAIETMPQAPFVEGKVFEKWVKEGTETEVTAETVVDSSFRAVAVFRTVDIYNITAEYYYNGNSGEVVFNTDLLQVEAQELPYTITAPATTQTDPNEVSGAPIYYPETPTVTVEESNFDSDKKCTVRVKYVPYTAEYDFVYMLKDLTGEGYTEIADSREHVYGVLNSYVTPTVKTFDYAVLELAQGDTISQAAGQKLKVYYTRKNYQLTYETNGGSYVGGATVPYGTNQAVTTTVPTRTGYTFAGWYLDEDLTQAAGSTVTVNKDTTLYAKWTGDTVNYTIVYIREKYENQWVYENSKDATGAVGTTVYAATAPKLDTTPTGYELDDDRNGTATSGGTGEDSAVVIEADGSTVLKVYYRLIRYTFIFDVSDGNEYRNGRYYYGNRDGKITINGSTYTGTSYRIENVVLGQDVSPYWPTDVTCNDDGWNYFCWNLGEVVTKRFEVDTNLIYGADSNHIKTFKVVWQQNGTRYEVEYYLQDPDDTSVYTKSEEFSQTVYSAVNPKQINGYTQHNGDASAPEGYLSSLGTGTFTGGGFDYGYYSRTQNPDFSSNTYYYKDGNYYYYYSRGGYGKYNGSNLVYTYRYYYDRNPYKIDYYFGSTLLDTINNIPFDANINKAPYVWTPTAAQCGVDSDYTFEGWYADDGLTTEYTFGKMPSANLILYAKWTAPSYTVSFVDGEDPSTHLAEDITVEKYKKVSAPETSPTKAGYTFDGWYTTADGNTLYDWNNQITEDTTIYAHWSRKALSYIVHYVDEDGNSVAEDKEVTNPNLVIGQSVTEQAIAVAGFRPQKNSETITLQDEGNVITFIYSKKGTTTAYTVRYIIDPSEATGGSAAVAAETTVNNVPGDTASVIELAKAVDYTALYAEYPELDGVQFFPDEVEKTFVLTASAQANVFTFYYSSYKNAKVTVNFVDMAGNQIANPDRQVLKVGKTFTLSRTPIAGWEVKKAVEGTEYNGTEAGSSYKITEAVTENGLTFTIFYQRKLTITAASDSKQYDGEALKLADDLNNQVIVEGLMSSHTLTGINFTYANTDNDPDNDGRVNAGIATVTPKDAVISGIPESADDYYHIRYISGTLEVRKINVTIRVEPDRWTGAKYNGTPYKAGFTNSNKDVDDYILISNSKYKASYLDDIWDAIKGKQGISEGGEGLGYYAIEETDAGEYSYTVGLTLADLPEDENYSVSLYVRAGRLQILPVGLTVTTGSGEKAYDGTALTNSEASLSGLVAADAEKVSVTATGTITEPGSDDNTYTITW